MDKQALDFFYKELEKIARVSKPDTFSAVKSGGKLFGKAIGRALGPGFTLFEGIMARGDVMKGNFVKGFGAARNLI